MNDLIIRHYNPSDLPRCRELWTELVQRHRDLYDDPSIGGEQPGLEFDSHLERLTADRIWVAELGGKVIGLFGLIVTAQEAELEPLIVKSEHRGKGIGRAMLKRAVEEAKHLRVQILCAKPVVRNVEVIALAYSAGFDKIGQVQLFMELTKEPICEWKSGLQLWEYEFDY
ncbi:MAG: GNAT family N-acetyltransferase [bacterium]